MTNWNREASQKVILSYVLGPLTLGAIDAKVPVLEWARSCIHSLATINPFATPTWRPTKHSSMPRAFYLPLSTGHNNGMRPNYKYEFRRFLWMDRSVSCSQ